MVYWIQWERFFGFGEKDTLPYMLANAGFDVWMTNNRGSIYSYEHINPKLDSNDYTSDYWDFSFDEMSKYDIIANIKYIKAKTNHEKVNYICHSQGCSQFVLSYTLYPDFYDQSIDKYATMGAALRIFSLNKGFVNLVKKLKILEILEFFKLKNIMSFHKEHTKYFGYLCSRALFICRTVISAIVEDFTTGQIDWEEIAGMYYYQPGGTSLKNLVHWLKVIENGEVRQFDYGKDKNLEIYGDEIPPQYDIEKLKQIKFDVFITNSEGDPYCTKANTDLLIEYFASSKMNIQNIGKYNHLDYLWGKNAHEDIYKHIIEFLNNP